MPRLLLALLVATLARAEDNHDFGAVTPVLLPDLPAHRQDGSPVSLRQLLSGRRSALQFVFTECPTTCPLLASLFHRVDLALPSSDPTLQLITITVDPERDTPARLTEWLTPFHPSPRWTALRFSPPNLLTLLAAFNLKPGAPAAHTLQIFLTDPQGRYYSRTTALPSTATLTAALTSVPTKSLPTTIAQPNSASGSAIYFGQSPLHATLGPDPISPAAARCASCHGANRTGRNEGENQAPSLLPSSLTAKLPRRGGPPSAYSQTTFCESLQFGRDPAGVQLSPVMPRYQLSADSCHQLWHFLSSPLP